MSEKITNIDQDIDISIQELNNPEMIEMATTFFKDIEIDGENPKSTLVLCQQIIHNTKISNSPSQDRTRDNLLLTFDAIITRIIEEDDVEQMSRVLEDFKKKSEIKRSPNNH